MAGALKLLLGSGAEGLSATTKCRLKKGRGPEYQHWREALLKLKSRGRNAPKPAIGNGAIGFRAAMDEVYPATRNLLPELKNLKGMVLG